MALITSQLWGNAQILCEDKIPQVAQEAGEFCALDGAVAEDARELLLRHSGYIGAGEGEDGLGGLEFGQFGDRRSGIVGAGKLTCVTAIQDRE